MNFKFLKAILNLEFYKVVFFFIRQLLIMELEVYFFQLFVTTADALALNQILCLLEQIVS